MAGVCPLSFWGAVLGCFSLVPLRSSSGVLCLLSPEERFWGAVSLSSRGVVLGCFSLVPLRSSSGVLCPCPPEERVWVIRYGCYSDPGEGESGKVWGKQCPSEQVRKTLLIVTWPAAKVPWDHEQGRRGEQTWGQRAHQESPRLGTWKKLQGAAGFGKEYTV